MTETSAKLFDKARRSLSAGENALAHGYLETAAGRAYYAMFYVAEALLNERGLRFRKHGGVHAALGEHFVKTGVVDARYHRWLLAAFNKRIVADYGVEAELSMEEVQEMLGQAREFMLAARAFMEGTQ